MVRALVSAEHCCSRPLIHFKQDLWLCFLLKYQSDWWLLARLLLLLFEVRIYLGRVGVVHLNIDKGIPSLSYLLHLALNRIEGGIWLLLMKVSLFDEKWLVDWAFLAAALISFFTLHWCVLSMTSLTHLACVHHSEPVGGCSTLTFQFLLLWLISRGQEVFFHPCLVIGTALLALRVRVRRCSYWKANLLLLRLVLVLTILRGQFFKKELSQGILWLPVCQMKNFVAQIDQSFSLVALFCFKLFNLGLKEFLNFHLSCSLLRVFIRFVHIFHI